MNVNSGGPHLLLFERDQQLTALLISEFQLAGFECRTARIAVEVFDAIARYPIRLVLVNLAQAAASRREFWVALDAQRRGRGVQVFTFRSINIAGYGMDDPDDRSRTVMPDIEVDGMLGVVNLVNAVTARVQGGNPNSVSRTTSSPGVSNSDASAVRPLDAGNRSQGEMPALNRRVAGESIAPSVNNNQATAPLPLMTSNVSMEQPSPPSTTQRQPPPPTAEAPGNTANSMPTFTDRIRAVIYPSSRSVSPNQGANWIAQNPASSATPRVVNDQDSGSIRAHNLGAHLPTEQAAVNRQARVEEPKPVEASPMQPGTLAYAETNRASSQVIQTATPSSTGDESGLAQLSRMVREQQYQPQVQEEPVRQAMKEAVPATVSSIGQVTRLQAEPEVRFNGEGAFQQARSGDSTPLSAMPLRASPIEDIPIERGSEHRIAIGGQAINREAHQPKPSDAPSQGSATTPLASFAVVPVQVRPSVSPGIEEDKANRESNGSTPAREASRNEARGEGDAARALMDQVQARIQGTARPLSQAEANVASEDTLLDIVQSLPPIVAQPVQPQPAALTGRATRSLGSVLLEGHLVPQQRLEVAQHIQRMLRGVDMNYQLGEILLMFKLLTPDQLLAASLVSYGLITTTQIIALGRIRQELHSIGLEYDLESLVVLFRILTPEQLREVRSSWSG